MRTRRVRGLRAAFALAAATAVLTPSPALSGCRVQSVVAGSSLSLGLLDDSTVWLAIEQVLTNHGFRRHVAGGWG